MNLLFKDLEVSPEILKAIQEMGFEEATPIQSQSIGHILEGKDVIAQAPTGTGKTCAFGIPAVENIDVKNESVQVLVLCPTRELVVQSAEELARVAQFKRGVKIVPIYGGQNIERQILALKKHPQILIATPGRMMDHLRRRSVKIDNLKMVVLDEGDEMLNMGFREDIDIILETVPKKRQTVIFSATLSKGIMEIAETYQHNAEFVKVTHKELTVPTIEQFYLEVSNRNKVDVLARLIDANDFKLSLIFCNTKSMVDNLKDNLSARGYAVEALHGDMKQMMRDRVMNNFKKGIVDILIATDVAARGLDIDNVDAVFNYDIPNDEEYYVHRIGRTGRANRKGVSFTFVNGKELYKLKDIMRYTKSKITLIKPPSITDVEEKRFRTMFSQIYSTIEKGNLSKYLAYIEKSVNERINLTTLEIAAALLKINCGAKIEADSFEEKEERSERSDKRESGKKRERDKDKSNANQTRMFINVGKKDNIKPGQIVNIITENSRVKPSNIGVIDIYDKFSFVEIDNEKTNEILDKIPGVYFKNREINIEVANKR